MARETVTKATFDQLDKRVESLDDGMRDHEKHCDERQVVIHGRIDSVNDSVQENTVELTKLTGKMENIEKGMSKWSKIGWGIVVATVSGLILAIVNAVLQLGG